MVAEVPGDFPWTRLNHGTHSSRCHQVGVWKLRTTCSTLDMFRWTRMKFEGDGQLSSLGSKRGLSPVKLLSTVLVAVAGRGESRIPPSRQCGLGVRPLGEVTEPRNATAQCHRLEAVHTDSVSAGFHPF